jgi:anion-transporting  ArsA/GET3 family ATPase
MTAPGPLSALLESKQILISVGPGGVGKTTTAAALALLSARAGRRSLVMTIDPAKRLAASLGLESLDHEEREVPRDKLAPAGVAPGLLSAMMLSQKRAFDEMVRRYAPDAATVERLMASNLYQQASSRLAGSQEYAAMEKLFAIDAAHAYELLVLDTPPTANALDFLEAPRKMVDAVDSPAVGLLVSIYRRAGRLSLNLLGFGAAYVFRRLARFTGGEFLDDIAGFLADLSGLLGGMRERAEKVLELLSRESTGFVIVTSPIPSAIDEAIGLFDRLVEARMSPSAFVVNRVHTVSEVAVGQEALAGAIEGLARLGPDLSARLSTVLLEGHANMTALARAEREEIARLKQHCGPDVPYVEVPLFDSDIFDIAGLLTLGERLQVGS